MHALVRFDLRSELFLANHTMLKLRWAAYSGGTTLSRGDMQQKLDTKTEPWNVNSTKSESSCTQQQVPRTWSIPRTRSSTMGSAGRPMRWPIQVAPEILMSRGRVLDRPSSSGTKECASLARMTCVACSVAASGLVTLSMTASMECECFCFPCSSPIADCTSTETLDLDDAS